MDTKNMDIKPTETAENLEGTLKKIQYLVGDGDSLHGHAHAKCWDVSVLQHNAIKGIKKLAAKLYAEGAVATETDVKVADELLNEIETLEKISNDQCAKINGILGKLETEEYALENYGTWYNEITEVYVSKPTKHILTGGY